MDDSQHLGRLVKRRSSELGFVLCGIAKVRYLDNHSAYLNEWLTRGFNAGMSYMERNLEKRLDPSKLVDGARSVIIVAMNYYQHKDEREDQPLFSRYSCGNDYHHVMKDRLYLLLDYLRSLKGDVSGRVFVDSAPILERAWAIEAGIGWMGKNSMLINRSTGSYLFLGAIVADCELGYDSPELNDYCGSCTKCIDACPTGALTASKILDSNRCISYLTIEHKEPFPEDLSLEGYVFGCDICQDVCPWNSKAAVTDEAEFTKLPEIEEYSTDQWKKVKEDQFNKIFLKSPVLRTGYKGFMRNLKYL